MQLESAEDKREWGAETMFEEIMIEKFPNNENCEFTDARAQKILSTRNMKREIKLLKTNGRITGNS